MRIILVGFILSISGVALISCAKNDDFKANTLADYKARCESVMKENGHPKENIDAVCKCEVKVIDDNFSTFSLIAFGVKKGVGAEPIDKEKADELKRKIKECKVES